MICSLNKTYSINETFYGTHSYGRLLHIEMKPWRTDPPSKQPHPPLDRTYLNSFFSEGSSNEPHPLGFLHFGAMH